MSREAHIDTQINPKFLTIIMDRETKVETIRENLLSGITLVKEIGTYYTFEVKNINMTLLFIHRITRKLCNNVIDMNYKGDTLTVTLGNYDDSDEDC